MPVVACSSEYVCVADDSAVDVYSAATLNALFRCVPTGNFIVHVAIRGTGTLHVVDAAGGHGVVDLKSNTPRPSRMLSRKDEAARGKEGDAATVVAASHFVAVHADESGAAVHRELCFVVLDSMGDLTLHAAKPGSATASKVIGSIPKVDAARGPQLCVGLETGVIAVGVPGESTLRLWSPNGPCSYNPVPAQVDVRIRVSTLAAHPNGYALAVGGTRGELYVMRDASDPSQGGFSDHWHHTPVTALLFAAGGHTLMSGAGEGSVCLWSLHDFSMTKLRTKAGALHALVAAVDKPSIVIAPSGRGSLALIDMVERRVTRRRDGVHWSASHPCRDVVVADWFGTPTTVLTGLPDVLRVFDPRAKDSLHTLVVTPNLETVQKPLTVGVSHVAVLQRGKTVVTFEEVADLALPSVLRWWKWQPTTRTYVEESCVFSPHGAEPLLGLVALQDEAVVTLSASSCKCWAPPALLDRHRADSAVISSAVASKQTDASRHRMHCLSEVAATRGTEFTAFCVSDDEAVAFVAEGDRIAAFDITCATSSRATWPRVLDITQPFTADSITRVEVAGACVIATTASMVIAVPLSQDRPRLLHEASRIHSATVLKDKTGVFVAAVAKKGSCECIVVDPHSGDVRGRAGLQEVDVVSCRAFDHEAVAVVSRSRGLRLVAIPSTCVDTAADDVIDAPKPSPAGTSAAPAATAAAGDRSSARGLAAFFRAAKADQGSADDAEVAEASVATRQRNTAARQWLTQSIGQGEAPLAPNAALVLDGYLSALCIQPTDSTVLSADAGS